MNLYHVVADPEGEDYGLLVRATNHIRALDCWRQHFALQSFPDMIRVVELDTHGEAGAVPWDEMPIVWERPH